MRIQLPELYEIFLEHRNIVTDSRQIIPGCIFFALKGEKFDGNAFASEAISKGSAFAVVDDNRCAKGTKYLLTENVITMLQNLAGFHRTKLSLPVIGITGTNGKTTTKELIAKVLEKKYKVCYTQGNLNNHIGVPLTILSIHENITEIAVIEMGANHVGEIAALCEIARPGYGIITNIGKAHLEGFGGYDGVIRAKNELYEYLRKHQGHVFVNRSDQLLIQLSKEMPGTTYGNTNEATLKGNPENAYPYLTISIEYPSGKDTLETQLIGEYNFENVMAATCIGYYFGIEPQQIGKAIGEYKPVNNRSQFYSTAKNHLILDAYNANPTSMEAALKSFHAYPADHKVVIAGDMLELGDESLPEHSRILGMMKNMNFESILLVGKQFMAANKNPDIPSFPDAQNALSWITANPVTGKTILIKASRGIHLEKLLGAL